MSNQVAVARVPEVPPGSLTACEAAGQPICLVRTDDGEFFAIEDRCSHEAIELSGGDLDGRTVECPLHGSRFDVATGEVLDLPAWLPVKTFPVAVAGDDVLVDIGDG